MENEVIQVAPAGMFLLTDKPASANRWKKVCMWDNAKYQPVDHFQ